MGTIVRLDEGASQLDLHGGTAKIKIVNWTPGVATESPNGRYGDIAETITVKVSASDHDDLATVTASIIEKLEAARAYDSNPIYVEPVWLVDRLGTENSAGSCVRRSLVKRGTVQPLYPTHGYVTEAHNFMPQLQVGLVRAPFWEGSAACTYTTGSMSGAASGEDMAATVVAGGDVPARISEAELFNAACTITLTNVWIGFKTDDVGGVAGQRNTFVPVWELEKGTPGSNARAGSISVTVAASFSPTGDGSGVYIDLTASAASAMVDRVTIKVSDVGGTGVLSKAFRGDYLVLLRALSSASDPSPFIPRVRLRAGYAESSTWTTGQRVQISSADLLQFYELGAFSIPDIRTNENLQNFSFRLEAERDQDVSGLLVVDCLSLIPIDRGFVKVSSGKLLKFDADPLLYTHSTRIYTEPSEEITGANIYDDYDVGDEKKSSPELDPINWSMPSGCGRVIAAWQRSGQSVITDKIKITFDYFPRWKLLRGSQ